MRRDAGLRASALSDEASRRIGVAGDPNSQIALAAALIAFEISERLEAIEKQLSRLSTKDPQKGRS